MVMDHKALGWPGELTNVSIVGDNLVGDSASAFWPSDAALFWANDAQIIRRDVGVDAIDLAAFGSSTASQSRDRS